MRSRLGKVIKECRGLVREYFIKWSANMSAHELAQVSHTYPDRAFDWSSVPIKIKNCIWNDLVE